MKKLLATGLLLTSTALSAADINDYANTTLKIEYDIFSTQEIEFTKSSGNTIYSEDYVWEGTINNDGDLNIFALNQRCPANTDITKCWVNFIFDPTTREGTYNPASFGYKHQTYSKFEIISDYKPVFSSEKLYIPLVNFEKGVIKDVVLDMNDNGLFEVKEYVFIPNK